MQINLLHLNHLYLVWVIYHQTSLAIDIDLFAFNSGEYETNEL